MSEAFDVARVMFGIVMVAFIFPLAPTLFIVSALRAVFGWSRWRLGARTAAALALRRTVTFVAANSFLAELQRFERGELTDTFRFEGADLQALLDRDVRWFALNREYFAFRLRGLVAAYDELFDDLFGQPVIRSTGLKIWDGERWEGRTEVERAPWRWPSDLHPGGPEMPLVGRRPKSPVFDSRSENPSPPE